MARHELWVELADRPGNLAALAGELAACHANIVHLDVQPGRTDTVIDRLVVQVPEGRERDLAAVAARFGATVRALGDSRDSPAPGDEGDHTGTGGDRGGGRPSPVPLPDRRHVAPSPSPGAPPVRRAPTTLERLVALPDGGLVRLRHLSAGDRDELVAHHERCSEATRRHSRFLVPGVLPLPPDDTTTSADTTTTTTDERRHRVALAALVGGEIVGVARFEREGGAVATAAVIIEDDHQRRGIGTMLIGELAVLAANADLRCLRVVAPAGTDGLQRTLRRAGLGFTVRRVGDRTVLDCGLPEGVSATA